MVGLRQAFIALAITAAVTPQASAQFMTGHKLVKAMEDYEKGNAQDTRSASTHFGTGQFMGFITGVHDTLDNLAFCSPPDANIGQLCAVVAKYLKNHPEDWDWSATILVQHALEQGFPCPPKPQR